MNSSKTKRATNSLSSSTNNNNYNQNIPKYLNKNYKTSSTEKLYSSIPKNIISNSKLNKDLKKSPSIKIAPDYEQGNNLFIMKQTDT